MQTAPQSSDLIDLLAQTRVLLDEFITTRTPTQQAETSHPQRWSARDLLSNLAFWMRYTVERMGFYERNAPAPQHVDFNALSLAAYHAGTQRTWPDVVTETHAAIADLAVAIDHFPAHKLNALNVYGEGEGGPLWSEIRANAFFYPLQELARFYTEHGEIGQAAAVKHQLRRVPGEFEDADGAFPPRISQDELQNLSAGALIIDVRGPSEYATGHVPGAVNIPITELLSRLSSIPRDQPIITYCNMNHPGQSRGERAARMLEAEGYPARVLDGGLNQWKAKHLPLDRG